MGGGAYGLRIVGIEVDESELQPAPASWPLLQLGVDIVDTTAGDREYVGPDAARLRLRSGGSVLLDRQRCSATFAFLARPPASALLHPHLAGPAAVASHWLGRDSFHAGGLVAGGGVWGVLGDRGSGKSSLLAAVAMSGASVLTDDLLVIERGSAFAGPRSIDLRSEAAGVLQAGKPLGNVGGRERWRVSLSPVDPELPLRGWVTLNWASAVSIRRVHGSDRLRALLAARALRTPPPHPQTLMSLSALPVWELTRPRDWRSMPDAIQCLLGALG